MTAFPDDAVEAIVDYMNTSHPEALLLIAQMHGAAADSAEAKLANVTTEHAELEVIDVAGRSYLIVAPWRRTISRRSEIRSELFELYERAL